MAAILQFNFSDLVSRNGNFKKMGMGSHGFETNIISKTEILISAITTSGIKTDIVIKEGETLWYCAGECKILPPFQKRSYASRLRCILKPHTKLTICEKQTEYDEIKDLENLERDDEGFIASPTSGFERIVREYLNYKLVTERRWFGNGTKKEQRIVVVLKTKLKKAYEELAEYYK